MLEVHKSLSLFTFLCPPLTRFASGQTMKTMFIQLIKRTPLYYGWVVWGVATLGVLATAPGQSFTVSLFFDSFIDDFDLSRSGVSALYGAATFAASLSLTWVGRQIDRFGNRFVSMAITVGFVGALVFMSFIVNPLMLFLGFFLIRGLGQGSLFLVSSTVIAQWFQRRRGLVNSLTIMFFGLFQVVYVPQLQQLLSENDWRTVWVYLAIGVASILLPMSYLFLYNRPEPYGLLPDGESEAQKATREAAFPPREDNYTLKEAMRTPLFWVFSLGRLMPGAWGTGMIIHQVSIFAELGYDAEGEQAALTFANFAFIAAMVALASGWIVDRFRPQVMMALQLFGLAMASGVTIYMNTPLLLSVYVVSFAIAMGSGGVFDGAVWANLYGVLHQGAIRGFVVTTIVFGTSIGPVIFGLSFDQFGSYDAALWLGVALSVVLGLASLLVPNPVRSATHG